MISKLSFKYHNNAMILDGKKKNFNPHVEDLEKFLTYFSRHITGREKAEGQIFFDRLFQGFGFGGVHEAGARCEEPQKRLNPKSTGFIDLWWKDIAIFELKKKGEKLENHYDQAFEYWESSTPVKPQFMVLCNFDEFWVYDLNKQLFDPVHKLKTLEIIQDWEGLGFLSSKNASYSFENDTLEVTKKTASYIGGLYLSLTTRKHNKIDHAGAQRFILQMVVALFSEDVGLLPDNVVYEILGRCILDENNCQELTDLFRAMSTSEIEQKPSKFENIDYFNGGLFQTVTNIELTLNELDMLGDASAEDWSKVRPSIFGSLFESSLDPERRHAEGAHFTWEIDINKIVGPTVVKPFREKIRKAKTKKEFRNILTELSTYKVLDPACGSGNFLYIAFRELRKLEREVLNLLGETSCQMTVSRVSVENFFGIDINEFAIDLAKVAMCLAGKLSADELGFFDNSLPFKNLDDSFFHRDALIDFKWPQVNAIIGNPPFLSSKKMKPELGIEYVDSVRNTFSDVSGLVDYCVYWFRKAHNSLEINGRSGLVGTNTIRQNYSREGGLQYIIDNNGVITEAVSSQVWNGDASVHVSIVNWVKVEDVKSFRNKKNLFTQAGNYVDSPWKLERLMFISSYLSSAIDLSSAEFLMNKKNKFCKQGQTPAYSGFYLKSEEARNLIEAEEKNSKVISPFLIGRDLLSKKRSVSKYIIDFADMSFEVASKYENVFQIINEKVYPEVVKKAEKEVIDYGVEKDWNNHLEKWWQLWRSRTSLIKKIRKMNRYIAVSRVTKNPIFEFVSSNINPGDALVAFVFDDDYSFGILQSSVHCDWFRARCSTLKKDWRYTGESVFTTFPWPQIKADNIEKVELVASAAKALREYRNQTMLEREWGLKKLYDGQDSGVTSKLRMLTDELDSAVLNAYGVGQGDKDNILEFLLELNIKLSKSFANGEEFIGPGLPKNITSEKSFISSDCLSIKHI